MATTISHLFYFISGKNRGIKDDIAVPLAAKKFICLGDAYSLILGSNVGMTM
jgi:hypothetical protein